MMVATKTFWNTWVYLSNRTFHTFQILNQVQNDTSQIGFREQYVILNLVQDLFLEISEINY